MKEFFVLLVAMRIMAGTATVVIVIRAQRS